MQTSSVFTPSEASLRLLVKGFNALERKLLKGTVMLSQRRQPAIKLVEAGSGDEVDVVMIDGLDPQARRWAEGQGWLARKAVIWVDLPVVAPGHTQIKRPVQWPALPMLLARAMENGPTPSADARRAEVAEATLASGVRARLPVLVVDDSVAVRAHLRSLLEPRGFVVTEVDSAEAGIQAAATGRFACVLMDVLMPGMDGYEACRRIKGAARAGEGPAVLMLTSKSSPFDRIRGKMAGCDAYLTKPVHPKELHEVLLRYASASAPEGMSRYTSAAAT